MEAESSYNGKSGEPPDHHSQSSSAARTFAFLIAGLIVTRSILSYSGIDSTRRSSETMSDFRNNLGALLQLAGLTFLPVLMIWQLNYGFNLLWMPSMTLVGVLVFSLGHWLRDKTP